MKKESIMKIYQEKIDFIIIGLTGLTGSGCTTTANLLKQPLDEWNLKPEEETLRTTDSRKNQIIFEYANKNKEYYQFEVIEVKNIIMSFILENDYKNFLKYVRDFSLLDKFKFSSNFEQLYSEMHLKRVGFKEKVDKSLKNYDESILISDELYNFYFHEINKVTDLLKEELDAIQTKLYTKLFQTIGRNIRLSGDILSDELHSDCVYNLSQRINMLIKILRKRNIVNKKGVRVVIDALRNPLEISFFKDRYSAFYVFSINAENDERKKRLSAKGFLDENIEDIEKSENKEKIVDKEQFAAQNIPRCLQLADVHLTNHDMVEKDETEFISLKRNLLMYITLIMQPGLITPTHVERCMNIAFNAKLNSGCISRQVGALVTDKNYSVVSIGWNSVPEGQTPCNLRNIDDLVNCANKEDFSEFERSNESFKKYVKTKKINKICLEGRNHSYCFKDYYMDLKSEKNQVHTRSLHAEENAFLQISKYGGRAVFSGILFTTASPCELCAKKAYQLGINTIYYIDPYPGISKEHILSAGINSPNMKLYYGAIGNAFTKLYNPIMSMKDELALFDE